MMKEYALGYFIVLLASGFIFADSRCIKDVFDVRSCWQEGMPWDEFNKIKITLERPGLVPYVDKIEQQKMAMACGLQFPKTYIASREKVPVAKMLSTLTHYVAKLTHLSWSDGLIIVKDGINMMTGKPITPDQVEKQLYEFLERKPREGQTWALFQVQPGFLVQEYIQDRREVKIQTVFGRAIVGDYRAGETCDITTPLLARFDRDGNTIQGTMQAPEWWHHAIVAAELMAEGTDALRVDLLVREDGELLLNELEIYPEINWPSISKIALAKAVSDGYRTLCLEGQQDE